MTSEAPPESARQSLRPSIWPPPPPRGLVARVGDQAVRFLEHLGRVSSMFYGAVRAGFRRPFEWREIVHQLESLGVASVGIVVVTSVFIGMVMAVQFAFGLRKFGGMEYTGRVVALSFARELAPSLTAIIVGGRIGSGMAAEVGAMNVTEQIDAVRALGADPLKKLVWPRLVASVIVMPILGGFALVLGFTGAMIVTDLEFQVPAAFFYRSALSVVTMPDVPGGSHQDASFRCHHRARRLPFRPDDEGRDGRRRPQHDAFRRYHFDSHSHCGLFSHEARHSAVA